MRGNIRNGGGTKKRVGERGREKNGENNKGEIDITDDGLIFITHLKCDFFPFEGGNPGARGNKKE